MNPRIFVGAVALVLMFAGCGGGDAGNGAAPPGGGTVDIGSGLVPTAPTQGATLYADAALLRPLRNDAVWAYRGTAIENGSAAPVRYTTTTSHTSSGASGATESTSNSGNTGPDVQPLAVSGGTVSWQVSLDPTRRGTPETVQFVELRSPVRQGDQYTILDRRYSSTAIDADGDGKPDVLDMAIYARVIGIETLALPNLPTLSTVRVDHFVVSRVVGSGNGQASPVTQSRVQTWYAAGIGIVRQTTAIPAPSGRGDQTTDEQLTSWDGGTAGLGAMTSRLAVVPETSPVYPGRILPGLGSSAFAFPEHALVFTGSPNNSTIGSVVSRVDLRGKIVATSLLPTLSMHTTGRLVGHAGGVIYLDPFGPNATATDLGLTQIGADGALIGNSATMIDLGGARFLPAINGFEAAIDGATLWVLWRRRYVHVGIGFKNELVLRPFTLEGVPQAPEILVDDTATLNPAISAGGGQVLLTWVRDTSGYSVMYATASVTARNVAAHTLATGLAASNSFITPLRLGGSGALIWPALLGSGTSVGSAGGVLVDAALQPIRSSVSLDGELIAGLPTFDFDMPNPAALGQRIVVSGRRQVLLWPEDANLQSVNVVGWIDTDSMPLASAQVHAVRYVSGPMHRQLVYPDRVLVFGGEWTPSDGFGLTTTVVWLNKGSTQ